VRYGPKFSQLVPQANLSQELYDNDSGRTSPTASDYETIDPGSLADDSTEYTSNIPDDSDSDSDSDSGADDSDPVSAVADLQTALDFIAAVEHASLENGDLDPDALERLRNPSRDPPDISDPAHRHALDMFLAATHASQESYDANRAAYLRRHPENDVLTHAAIKRKVAEWSGVVPILSHMCPKTCAAYTGPYSDRQSCPICGLSRFDANGSPQEFYTIPLGPQLQALFGTPESAKNMHYRREKTAEILASMDEDGNLNIPVYEDYLHGRDYLDAVVRGDIKDTDVVVIGSIDGAQLYRNKHSDCWISIWIIAELTPEKRYKVRAVLPDSFIPGPNKPKHLDSFKFPSVHHLSALQKEGLQIWDAFDRKLVTSHPYLLMETADGPGMTGLNGLVGHHGVYGCRLYCPLKGRRKDGKPHYYPVMMCPTDYSLDGCDHPDVDPESLRQPSEDEYLHNLAYLLKSKNETDYKERRKATGICKPSLFGGLLRNHRLGIPGCFPFDVMHWGSLNWTELVLALFRGTLRCDKPDSKDSWIWAVLVDEVWKAHGQAVADATPYLPGSFDRPPRNPAEKISSGYKAWEYLLYIVGLAPFLLAGILPDPHWQHLCKGVAVIRCFHQFHLPIEHIIRCHKLAIEYVAEFETLYFQGMPERIHFVRQSVHTMTHLAPETIRVGPAALYSQWTMERTIGNLGQEIKSDSQPYANLSERGLRRSQVNALKALIPDLDPDTQSLPRGSVDLGDAFVLLRARDEYKHHIEGAAGNHIRAFLEKRNGPTPGVLGIVRWARLRLPNGQIARSAWKELRKPLNKVRMARNVKVCFSLEPSLRYLIAVLIDFR
jgi:hypothetical protein